MSMLISISSPVECGGQKKLDLDVHRVRSMPVVVLSPHNQCNCRCMMCDIWRIREPQEISPSMLEEQLWSFRELGVRWVVFTGGEPQLNGHWSLLAQMLRAQEIRVTMLTAGLLLQPHAEAVAANIDDVIVSLDGPQMLHNHIRRVADAYERISAGVKALRRLRPDFEIRARCTVQKANCESLRAVVQTAKDLGLNSISFLAADLTSVAFNRSEGWLPERQNQVALNAAEVEDLSSEIEQLISEHENDLASGYVVESAPKLRRIIRHFRAHLGQLEPAAPRCNAPWVSAVVEASGDVRPCFFHPAIGNIHSHSLHQVVNGPQALRFRAELDVASNPVCQRCVCSLHISQG
jgi:MoaA/NifB/PqqE/SkfB family radical SAM enzyme